MRWQGTFHCAFILAIALNLAGCNPTLNWRTVPIEQLAALFPCKPDRAERQVDLGGVARTLTIWGCESGGALFAVSHLQVQTPANAEQVIAAWQVAALRNIPGVTSQALPFHASALVGLSPTVGTMLRATGKRADGQVLQAQLGWFSRGSHVYHLAVFAPEVTSAMTASFFTEWQWL